MIKPIIKFTKRFNASISLDDELIVKGKSRYFLINENLKRLVSKDFFYAGVYLGKTRGEEFFPSFGLLRIVAKEKANNVIIDKKTEWLFICGKDIFHQGILRTAGSGQKGQYVLVLNQHDECLGFGKILEDLHVEREGIAIKNISDIGDFLRRERNRQG